MVDTLKALARAANSFEKEAKSTHYSTRDEGDEERFEDMEIFFDLRTAPRRIHHQKYSKKTNYTFKK